MTALKRLRHSQATSRPFLILIPPSPFLLLTVVFVASSAFHVYGKSVNQLGATYIWLDSTIGRDSNNGSREAPLASFEGLFRLSANVNSSSVHVYLAPGFYPISHFMIEKEQAWHFSSCSDCIGTGKDVAIGLIASDDPDFVFRTNFQHSQTQPQIFFSNLRFCPAFNTTLSHTCASNLPQAPASLPIFKYPIFGVKLSGVRLENCEIRNFMLQNPLSPDINPSIFRTTIAPIELINTDVSYNYMLFDRQPYRQQDSRLLVDANTMVIHNCTFRENRFSVSNMNGGLIQAASLEIHNSLFIHNTGMANRGQGLLFWIQTGPGPAQVSGSSPVQVIISNCTFKDQNFEWTRGSLTIEEVMEVWNPLGPDYHLTKWSDSQQPSLTSGAVFSIIANLYLSFNMDNSICENNNASRGACVAVSTDVNSILPTRASSELSQLFISNSLHTRNYASSGVGSAVYIDASFYSNITISNVTFFTNLANVSSFTWYGPSDPLVIADPSLLHISYASSTTIKLESITLNGTGLDDLAWNFRPTPTIETHRLYVSNAKFLHLKDITFSWAVPDRFSGSYIFIRAPAFAELENIVLKPVLSEHFYGSDAPTPYPWSFILLEGDPVLYQDAKVHIKGLWIDNWDSRYHSQVMELLQSQSISNLRISECHINSLGFTGTSPIILIQDSTDVIFENSNFRDFQLPIVFNSIQELQLNNISIVDYSSSKSAINIEQVVSTLVEHFFGNTSHASFISIQNGVKIIISDSQFHASRPEVPTGAVTASWLAYVQVLRSEFANNQAELGPALLLNNVEDLHLFSSVFQRNLATRDGGAIVVTGGAGKIDVNRCHFLNNSALRSGGSIYTTQRLRLYLSHFNGNLAGRNGGAICRDSEWDFSPATGPELRSSLEGCSFHGNRASSKGAGIYYKSTGSNLNLLIEKTQFEENIAGLAVDNSSSLLPYNDGLGGALYSEGSTLTIVDSAFKRNKAGTGGALLLVQAAPLQHHSAITSSNFTSNHALSLGGAVAVIHSLLVLPLARVNIPGESTISAKTFPWTLAVAGCRFHTNQAEFGGGAIASIGVHPVLNISNVFDTNMAHYGGALYVSHTSSLATLINQTFTQNTVIWAGGIIFYESIYGPQDLLLQADLSNTQSFTPNPPQDPLIPIDHGICTKSFCSENVANGWGNLTATGRAYLMAHTLQRSEISAISMPVELSTKPTRNVVASFLTYPGLENIISIGGTDQFGQRLKAPPDFGTVQFICDADYINSRASSVPNYLLEENLGMVRFKVWLNHTHFASNFTPTTGFLVYTAQLPGDSHGIVTGTTHNIRVTVSPCGPGFGPNSKLPWECQTCPLFTYSVNGHCRSCASDRKIKQCSGETIESNANFWVSLNNVTGEYLALRCPGGFCIGENRCTMTRTGTMCGQCIKPFHESVLSECVNCPGPNWIMIAIVVLGLWVASILLHMLLAASSGKAGILIFYIQTCFVIAYVAPISDAFGLNSNGSLPAPIQFILCLLPMNYLQRSMMYGLVPFIMMAQITVTFLIHRVIYFAVHRVSYEAMLRQTHRAPPGTLHVEDSLNFEKDNEDYDEKDQIATHDQQPHRSSTPSSNEFSTGQDSSGLKPRVVQDQVFENGDMVHLQSDFEAGTYERAHYEWSLQNQFFHWFRLIRTLLSLFANSFSSILGIVMSTVGCIDLLDGERVLQAAPGVSCHSNQFKRWQQLLGLFIPYLAIVFTTLLVKLLQLYFKKRLSMMDVRFGVWYEMYRSKLFAWKLTEMVRRLCIAIASNLLIAEPQLRASVLAILALIFLVIQLIARPYRQQLENLLESLSLASLALLSIVILWYSRHRYATTANSAALGAWVIVITMLIVIVCGFLARKIRLWLLQRKSSK